MQKYLIIIAACITFTSCGAEKKETTEASAEHAAHDGHDHASHSGHGNPKAAELMAAHDSIMLKMGEMMALKSRISDQIHKLDSLNNIKPVTSLTRKKAEALELSKRLESADQSMMGWMHQYNADTLEKLDESGQDEYVANQIQKMHLVKSQINSVIVDANKFINDQQ